ITRSHTADSNKYVRTMKYDSLGRLVENDEPNTSQHGVQGIPNGAAIWRYAYDDAGDLVATVDARGCGKNLFYDGAGRLVAEDFSPCLKSHADYTPADPNTGEQTEAFYRYDAPETATPTRFFRGHLTSISDRAARTTFAYDGRGMVANTERQLAKPGVPADRL